jgi:hypothetical protein
VCFTQVQGSRKRDTGTTHKGFIRPCNALKEVLSTPIRPLESEVRNLVSRQKLVSQELYMRRQVSPVSILYLIKRLRAIERPVHIAVSIDRMSQLSGWLPRAFSLIQSHKIIHLVQTPDTPKYKGPPMKIYRNIYSTKFSISFTSVRRRAALNIMNNGIFWDVTPCSSRENRRFGGS